MYYLIKHKISANIFFIYYIFAYLFAKLRSCNISLSLSLFSVPRSYNRITTRTHDYGNFTEVRCYIKLYASLRDVIVRYAHRGIYKKTR